MAIPVSFKNPLSIFFGGKPGNPVQEAAVFLEPEKGDVPVAFQLTGKSGGVTFAHLDKGKYKLVMTLPQQEGKLANKRLNLPGDFQFGYHNAKRKYFIREYKGFFMIRYSGIKNLSGSNIIPTFNTDEKNPNRMVTAHFEVDNKFGAVTMEILALSEKKFRKLINKYKNDLKMTVIQNQSEIAPAK
jgi:hypothetical protein